MLTVADATQTLVDFARSTQADSIPQHVLEVGRDLIVDSVGCALAGHSVDKGKLSVDIAADFGGGSEVTIIGGKKASVLGGTFANGELINAIDMDAILLPGHVTPYVVPPALAAAELVRASGLDLVRSVVIAHEVAARVAGSMAPLRQAVEHDGMRRIVLAPVTGYGSTIIGAALGAGVLFGLSQEELLDCAGLAGYSAPVPALGKYLRLEYGPTVKYTSAGVVAAAAMLSARLAAAGYTGDRDVLDGEVGFWRMFASDTCDWDFMLEGLGDAWHVASTEFKPYPSFRMGHPGVEAFIDLLHRENIPPEQIDEIEVRVDPIAASPIYVNRKVERQSEAYISWAHVLAAAALYPPGAQWHSPEAMSDPRLKILRSKVRVVSDQEMINATAPLNEPVSNPVEVRVSAHGSVYQAELMEFPKGHPQRPLTESEFEEKFVRNARTRFSEEDSRKVYSEFMTISEAGDVASLLEMLLA